MTANGRTQDDGRVRETGPVLGRPRSADADEAITSAALRLLTERGPAGVTIEAVARRSGVAKTTIYRRYRNRDEVLRASLEVVRSLPVPPPGLPTRDRVVMMMNQFREGLENAIGLRTFTAVLLEAEEAEFVADFRRLVLTPRLDALLDIFGDGIASGEVRPDVDRRSVVHLLIGSYFARSAIEGGVPDNWAETVVDALWPAVAVTPGRP